MISLKNAISVYSYKNSYTFSIDNAIEFFKSLALKIDQNCGRLDYSLKVALFAQDIKQDGYYLVFLFNYFSFA